MPRTTGEDAAVTVRRIDPEYLRRVAQTAEIAELKTRAYGQLRLDKGGHVIDIGCGPAIDTIALAKIVGPTGQVIGVDGDPSMVKEANRAAVEAGVGGHTKHVVADAGLLPFPSSTTDALFCERVLQHIPFERCRLVVNEMFRVLKPGGRLVVIDTDWATLSIATNDPLLERRIVAEHALGFANPYSGRNLLALLRNANTAIDDVKVEAIAIPMAYESVRFLLTDSVTRGAYSGRISWTEVQRFIAAVSGARDYRVYCAHLTLILVSATKGD